MIPSNSQNIYWVSFFYPCFKGFQVFSDEIIVQDLKRHIDHKPWISILLALLSLGFAWDTDLSKRAWSSSSLNFFWTSCIFTDLLLCTCLTPNQFYFSADSIEIVYQLFSVDFVPLFSTRIVVFDQRYKKSLPLGQCPFRNIVGSCVDEPEDIFGQNWAYKSTSGDISYHDVVDYRCRKSELLSRNRRG